MNIAGPQDWKTEPFPDKHVTLDLQLTYSSVERLKIIKGLVPEVMEEKWFVYYDQGVLNFHRSWTGYCVYRAYCHDENGNFTISHADVNREVEQYKETNDDIDRQMISYLIDVLLLQKKALFPSADGCEDDVLKIWSSVGKALCAAKVETDPSTDFVRIIPAKRFVGLPVSPHRPYAFYADAASLKNRTIADCYSLVNGLRLPPMEPDNKYCNPFLGRWWNDYDSPFTDIKIRKKNRIISEELPLKKLEKAKFVVLRVSRSDAVRELDVFPATWRALSYIVSDPKRMGVRQLGQGMKLSEYASASIHALFKEVHADNEKGLLALMESKENLGLCDLEHLPSREEEHEYYNYLSRDSAFTNNIIELFGLSCRCWFGCGYIGSYGKPLCRFYLLQNKITPEINVSVMNGKDLFL